MAMATLIPMASPTTRVAKTIKSQTYLTFCPSQRLKTTKNGYPPIEQIPKTKSRNIAAQPSLPSRKNVSNTRKRKASGGHAPCFHGQCLTLLETDTKFIFQFKFKPNHNDLHVYLLREHLSSFTFYTVQNLPRSVTITTLDTSLCITHCIKPFINLSLP